MVIHIIITAIAKWGYCSTQLHDADELRSRNTQLYHPAYWCVFIQHRWPHATPMMAELLHWPTASTGTKQTSDTALTAPFRHTSTDVGTSNSPEHSTSECKHKYSDFHYSLQRFPCHLLIRATTMNCVRILRWQHFIIGSLTLPRFKFNPYPTAFPYGNGMVLHFYQQQESSTTKTVHKVINKGLKTYV